MSDATKNAAINLGKRLSAVWLVPISEGNMVKYSFVKPGDPRIAKALAQWDLTVDGGRPPGWQEEVNDYIFGSPHCCAPACRAVNGYKPGRDILIRERVADHDDVCYACRPAYLTPGWKAPED